MSAWIELAPLLCLLIGGLAVMLLDVFVEEKAELASVATGVFLVAGGLAVGLWLGEFEVTPAVVAEGGVDFHAIIARYLATDRMSLLFDIAICAGAAFASLLAGGYLREHGLDRGEFYVLLVFSAFGAMVLARAIDLLSIFIGLETMSLGVYAMVAFRRTSPRAAEGAIKYFLLGSFAAAIFLFGAALLYGATGHTNLAAIGQVVASGKADPRLVSLSLLMLLVGLGFKVSAVPFHQWTPDAYEGAATPATTFMAVVVKAAAFAVLLRVLFVCFGDELHLSPETGWPPVIAALAAITMVYGNLAAVAQTSVKRMLAYSSIAHAGFLLMGVTAAFKVREEGLASVFYYILAYTVSNALAFGSLILMGSRGREAVTFDDLAGAGRRHPLAAVPFVVAILSLMGMPPTAGFFGKYYVLTAAMHAGGGMVWLALIGVLSSAIGAYYYLRVLVYLFMKQPEPGAPIAVPMKSGYVATALLLSGYFVLRMGMAPDTYLEMARQAAAF